jgi:LacI family transcriptional regulator
MRGVSRFYSENGSWSAYFKPRGLDDALPDWLKSWKGTGILARITSKQMGKSLKATGLPLIDLRGGGRSLGIPPFGPSSQAVSEIAFDHLRSLGFEHFAFCGEPRGAHVYDDERMETFKRIAIESGFTCSVFKHRIRGHAVTWEDGQEQLATWLKSLPRPVGIMASHDDRGQQVLDACRRAELLVPNEVAVIGSDNSEFLCNLSIPSLSSIDVNSERIGYEAAHLLDRMMEGKATFNDPVYFKPIGVVIRQSTDVQACSDKDIATALMIIRRDACRGISVSELSNQLPLSRTLLNRRFKKIVGRSPKAEILRIQVEAAKRMLIDTSLPVSTISNNTGFSDSKYFISVFRKLTGNTPRGFRQQCSRHNGLLVS